MFQQFLKQNSTKLCNPKAGANFFSKTKEKQTSFSLRIISIFFCFENKTRLFANLTWEILIFEKFWKNTSSSEFYITTLPKDILCI